MSRVKTQQDSIIHIHALVLDFNKFCICGGLFYST